jgi:chitosanase
MLTPLQKATAQAVVQIFETGKIRGDYAQVTLLKGDTGGLTYGKAQTTLNSGNLATLLDEYCREPGAVYAPSIHLQLPRLRDKDPALNGDTTFHETLERAGDDPIMHRVQDRFFDRLFWKPVEADAQRKGFRSPLAHCIFYDSRIHGSLRRVLDMTERVTGRSLSPGMDEAATRAWLKAYVRTRRMWLTTHRNTLLRKTVYRMETFEGLIAADKWELDLPLNVRGLWITEETLSRPQPARGRRLLALKSPMMTGWDVRALQVALSTAGVLSSSAVDGVFGRGTQAAVWRFQKSQNLAVDGKAGDATFRALGLSFQGP